MAGCLFSITVSRCRLRRGWMTRAEEKRMFESWDGIFREIREKNERDGVHVRAPADTRELRDTNVIKELKATHATRRRIPVRSA